MGKRSVTFEPQNTGAFLTEVARAFLHGGTPSALLSRIIASVEAFEAETASVADRDFAACFRVELDRIRAQWRRNEDRAYGSDATIYYTCVIPYTETNRTEWHPTAKEGPFSVLSRGSFKTAEAAHEWARTHIPGTAYTVRSNVADHIGEEDR